MTKIYVVTCTCYVCDEKTSMWISGCFTNKKKALSLIKFLKAEEELHKDRFSETDYELVEQKIDNFDYTKAAIEKEELLLPY